MSFDKNLTDRSEKRFPVMVPVRFSALQQGNGEVEEKTYTDNLSSRGVRVCSIRSWRPGDQVEVDSVDQGPPIARRSCLCARSLTKLVSSLASSSIREALPGAFYGGSKGPEVA